MEEIQKKNRYLTLLIIPIALYLLIFKYSMSVLIYKYSSVLFVFFFLFAVVLYSNKIALYLIFIPSFTQGLLMIFGIPTIVPRGIMELTIFLLFIKSLYIKLIVKGEIPKVYGFYEMSCLFLVSLFSYIYNGIDSFSFIIFCRHIFIFYLFFVALLNLNISEDLENSIDKFLIFLFLIQLPAAIIKFFIMGVNEKIVGTIAYQAGTMSTILPLYAISFLLSFYFYEKKNIYIYLIFCYIGFGLVGEKRGLAFFIPLVMMVNYYFFSKAENKMYKQGFLKKIFNKKNLKYMFIIVSISALGLYFASKTLMSLNPESSVGGSFDLDFMIKTAIKYETKVSPEGYSFGRISSAIQSYNVLEKKGLFQILFGLGPGALIESSLLDRDMDLEYFNFGIISGKTGIVWFILQTGLIGTILLVLFFMKILKRASNILMQIDDGYNKKILLGFIGGTFIFILDFLFYSNSTLTLGILTPTFYYLAKKCLYLKKNLDA